MIFIEKVSRTLTKYLEGGHVQKPAGRQAMERWHPAGVALVRSRFKQRAMARRAKARASARAICSREKAEPAAAKRLSYIVPPHTPGFCPSSLPFQHAEPKIEHLRMYPKGNLFIPASHGKLEAILKEPAGTPKGVALVCHPHPLGGGTMHNKVVFRVAAGLVDAGLNTLRFNFRGVGASTGEHEDVPGGRDDVRDAVNYLASEFPDHQITLAGFSFGSRTGLEVGIGDDRVVRLISIGTPVDKYGDYDFLTAVRKPILFVHGDKDEFGSVENVRKLYDSIKPHADAELKVFQNSGHFFDDHLNELRETVKDWTELKLKGENVKK